MDIQFETSVPDDSGDCLFETRFESDLQKKNRILDDIMRELEDQELLEEPEDYVQFRLCMDEALVNAIMHGNREDPGKEVFITVHHEPETRTVSVRIEDEGSGFERDDLPDPEDSDTLLRENQRGILLMDYYMDQLMYYNEGSGLYMERKKD